MMEGARAQVLKIFEAGVRAADPYAAVSDALYDVSPPALIVAVGKAARLMAKAALNRFSGVACLVVTNYENAACLDGATVMAAGHPVPDENGAAAAQAVIAALSQAQGPVLALISGGGSALLPAPAGGLTLTDKAEVNRVLLGAGLDITSMNLVRQQLSDLKGGGFLRHAAPQKVTALVLSDVIGDDLSAIASGPTVGPIGTAADAMKLLTRAGLWDVLPASVRAYLQHDKMPKPLPEAVNIVVGSNSKSVAAMAQMAGDVFVIPEPIVGDVGDAARMICDQAASGTTVWGGETTVVLRGLGCGGRNQELALRIAQEAAKRGWNNWTCLQGGSDGRDGPTNAAGAIVDQDTLGKIADIEGLLANNDSYAALVEADDLLITKATGTNVADLGIMIRDG